MSNSPLVDVTFAPQPTLFQNVKDFNVTGILNSLRGMNFNWIQMGVFFSIGGLSGFLFKKYFKTVFVWSICGLGLVAALEYAGLISIDWGTVQGLIGVAPTQDFDNVIQSWFAWSQVNMSLIVCGTIGFIFGYKAA